jgi:hypothetical protein
VPGAKWHGVDDSLHCPGYYYAIGTTFFCLGAIAAGGENRVGHGCYLLCYGPLALVENCGSFYLPIDSEEGDTLYRLPCILKSVEGTDRMRAARRKRHFAMSLTIVHERKQGKV